MRNARLRVCAGPLTRRSRAAHTCRDRKTVRCAEYDPDMAVAEQTLQQLRSAGLAEIDPEIAELLGREHERQRGQIELIASENFTWPSIFEAVGSRADEQVRRGLPRQALLRRLRGDRRDRADRDRPRALALRRRARERAAARGRPDEHGRLPGRARPRRHDPLARALARRPPDARAQGQLLRAAYTIVHYGVSRRRMSSTTTRCSAWRSSTGRS